MEKIDLSTNSKKVQELYNKVLRGDGSTTYGVFSVDKNGVLEATTAGSGDLSEFVSEFSDGQVQFGLARVTVPGSDVFKNLLLGWCPDNAPAKLRLSFATNFADVSKILSGYHVQITARDSDDLDVEEFLSRVGAAAGARYLIQTASGSSFNKKPAPKPATTVTASANAAYKKPASFIPKSTGKPIATITPKPATSKPTSASKPESNDDDEWGGEKEIEERDFETRPLEDVPSAYKPTKVDIFELRKQKSDSTSSHPKAKPTNSSKETEQSEPTSLNARVKSFQLSTNDGRLTSLPKPKVNHSVASRYTPSAASDSGPTFGSKPSFGKTIDKKDKLVGGLSRNFAAENGKTPAQLWAEKRGQYKEVRQNADAAIELSPIEETLTEDKPLELESKFNTLRLNQENDDIDHEVKQGPNDEAEKEDGVDKGSSFKPTIIKPATGGFIAPPKRTLPPVSTSGAEKEDNEEEAERKGTEDNIKASTLSNRALPPPPARQELKVEEPNAKEAVIPALPKREEQTKDLGVSAVAQYDYEKDEDNEVEFTEGDVIVEIEFVDEEWWSGKNSRTGESGLFPGSYVTLIDTEESKEEPPTAEEVESSFNGKTAIAEYDYVKDEDNEISFDEGDLIVEIDFVDEDWWSGKHEKSGSVGLFPANYVKLQ